MAKKCFIPFSYLCIVVFSPMNNKISSFLFFLLLFSCTSHRQERLEQIDQTLSTDIELAGRQLDSIRAESLTYDKEDRMKFLLIDADHSYKSYTDSYGVKELKTIAKYFEEHGTTEERLRSAFLYGSTLYENDSIAEASKVLMSGVHYGEQDNLSPSGYAWLSKIYNELGMIYAKVYAAEHSDSYYKRAADCVEKSGDSLLICMIREDMTNVFLAEGKLDSLIWLERPIFNYYIRHHYDVLADFSAKKMAYAHIDKGEPDAATPYIKRLYRHSSSEGGFELVNYVIGKYYEQKGDVDSALYYYRRDAKHEKLEYRVNVIGNMLKIFDKQGATDSIRKYAILQITDLKTEIETTNTQTYQQIHEFYNFDYYKRLSEEEKRTGRILRLAFLLGALALIASAAVVWDRIRRRSQKRIAEKDSAYNLLLNQYSHAEEQLNILQKNLEEEKGNKAQLTEDINTVQNEVNALREQIKEYTNIELGAGNSTLILTPIVQSFLAMATADIAPTPDNWAELRRAFELYDPLYLKQIRALQPGIKEQQERLCMVCRIHCSPTQMAALLSISRGGLANARKRLYRVLTGEEADCPQKLEEYLLSLG